MYQNNFFVKTFESPDAVKARTPSSLRIDVRLVPKGARRRPTSSGAPASRRQAPATRDRAIANRSKSPAVDDETPQTVAQRHRLDLFQCMTSESLREASLQPRNSRILSLRIPGSRFRLPQTDGAGFSSIITSPRIGSNISGSSCECVSSPSSILSVSSSSMNTSMNTVNRVKAAPM